nr:hypothetical protein [uncultured Undibacterium sp.]
MKKPLQLLTRLRRLAEPCFTVVFGLICLMLIVYYWPSDTEEHTKREVVGKVLIVLDGEKIILLKRASVANLSAIAHRTLF